MSLKTDRKYKKNVIFCVRAHARLKSDYKVCLLVVDIILNRNVREKWTALLVGSTWLTLYQYNSRR